MPYSIEWEKLGVRWIYTGVVNGQDVLQSNRDVYGDARFDKMRYQLADFLKAESFNFTEMDVKQIAYMDKAAATTNPFVKVAIAADHEVAKELTNLYAKYAEDSPWETRIFETIEEAKKWIGF